MFDEDEPIISKVPEYSKIKSMFAKTPYEFKPLQKKGFLENMKKDKFDRNVDNQELKNAAAITINYLVNRINRQIEKLNFWNIALLSYGIVDMQAFIKPVFEKIQKYWLQLQSKIPINQQSNELIGQMTDLYRETTVTLDAVATIYKNYLKDLESQNNTLCEKLGSKDEESCKKLTFTPIEDSLLSRISNGRDVSKCTWKKKSLVGFNYGKETCTGSDEWNKYVAKPARDGNYSPIIGESGKGLSEFILHPTLYALY